MSFVMQFNRYICMRILCIVCLWFTTTLYGQNWLNKNKYGVVRIKTQRIDDTIERGSGVIFRRTLDNIAYIVTCHHVVKKAKAISADIEGREIKISSWNKRDEELDLAILVTSEPISDDFIPLKFNSKQPEAGETIYAYGYEEGRENFPIPGQIIRCDGKHIYYSLKKPVITGNDSIADKCVTEGIPDGFSGGPVFNMQGEVLGISIECENGQNHAVKTNLLINIIEGLDIPFLEPSQNLGIWIARITNDNDNNLQKDIINKLDEIKRFRFPLRDSVEIRDLGREISRQNSERLSHRSARTIGRMYNAFLVGWGAVTKVADDVTFYPKITLIPGSSGKKKNIDFESFAWQPSNITGPKFKKNSLTKNTISQEAQEYLQFMIGISYFKLEEIKKALNEFQEIAKHYENRRGDNWSFIGDTYLFCGILCWYLAELENTKENLKLAESYYKKAREYYKNYDENNDERRIRFAHVENNIGLVYLFGHKNYDDALTKFLTAKEIYESCPDIDTESENSLIFNNLVISYTGMKQYKKAVESGNKGLQFYRDNLVFDIPISFKNSVIKNQISDSLIQIFYQQKQNLSKDAYYITNPGDSSWMLLDRYNNNVFLIKKGAGTLGVYEVPEILGMLFNNLGVAYYYLAKKTKKEIAKQNIELAIQTYLKALEIRRRTIFSLGYAKTTFNLGLAYEEYGDYNGGSELQKALLYFKNARDAYQDLENQEKVKKVERAIKRIENKIDDL